MFLKTKTGYSDACNTDACGGGLLNTSGKKQAVGYGHWRRYRTSPSTRVVCEQAKNITIKVEYLYLGIERRQTSSGTSSTDSAPLPVYVTSDRIRGIHTAKIGINYHFDGF